MTINPTIKAGIHSCILCNSDRIQKTAVIGKDFTVWKCQECSFLWVDRQDLDKPEAFPSYESYQYNHNIRNHFEQMKNLYIEGFQKRIRRTLGNQSLENRSFLDVGCANGEYLWTARNIGFGQVSGVEIDPEAAMFAKAHGEVSDDIRKLSLQSYDVVQVKNVISNITDFSSFLTLCISVLKPDGFLLLDVLNQDSLTAILRNTLIRDYSRTGRYGPLRPPYVINGFNQSSLQELFRRFGLEPTWLGTSYMGNALVPYAPSHIAKTLGSIGSLVGRGSMLISESKRVLPS
jgi:2-polyprenyl-3-methyl-5-hydroxy-6-metoxy-1,4-benzoquinol methylase